MYSRCLVVSKFVLRKINFDVWFDQTFLQKMLYIAKPPNFPYTSSAVNMLIMNQFHSFTKETKPSKKRKSNPIKLRSRGGGEGEIGSKIGAEVRSSGEIERRRDWRRDRSGELSLSFAHGRKRFEGKINL